MITSFKHRDSAALRKFEGSDRTIVSGIYADEPDLEGSKLACIGTSVYAAKRALALGREEIELDIGGTRLAMQPRT